jgi:hypothetical protein
MLCFEVYRNGSKLCMAGIGDCGVLSAIVTWVSHHPGKLARWAAEGAPDVEPARLELSIGGLTVDESELAEHLKWEECSLKAGDEIHLRIVDAPNADPPQWRYRDDPARTLEGRKDYVRRMAKEFGWEIRA